MNVKSKLMPRSYLAPNKIPFRTVCRTNKQTHTKKQTNKQTGIHVQAEHTHTRTDREELRGPLTGRPNAF